jgi:hypothetical protein
MNKLATIQVLRVIWTVLVVLLLPAIARQAEWHQTDQWVAGATQSALPSGTTYLSDIVHGRSR